VVSRLSPTTCEDGYWDKGRAASYLSVKPHTIDYLVRTGRLPFYLIAGKRRFLRSDLNAYALANRECRDTA